MEEKLRKKRIRKIVLIILAAALFAGIGLSTTVEKADYGKTLGEEIENAQELLETAVTGYDKGEYLPEAVTMFQECIEEAEAVFADKKAVYDEQKAAYEKLKADEDAFKATVNEKDLKKKEVKKKEKEIEKELEPEKEKKSVKHESKRVKQEKKSSSADKDKKTEDKKSAAKKEKKSSPQKKTKKKKTQDTKAEEEYITVNIQIRCDNLVGNVEDESIASYVPSSGVILGKTEYRCRKGTTVYDVLYAVCRNNNIQIESQYTPVYNSQYVEALNHIYEFDGGPESGWMFRVNGAYPDYACSSYVLNDGDNIVWAYTCNLGKDLGDSF